MFGREVNDQFCGRATRSVSAPLPNVINFAVTVIGVALVPDVPIAADDVAVASVMVAALAGAENTPRTRAKLAAPVRAVLKTLFTIFL